MSVGDFILQGCAALVNKSLSGHLYLAQTHAWHLLRLYVQSCYAEDGPLQADLLFVNKVSALCFTRLCKQMPHPCCTQMACTRFVGQGMLNITPAHLLEERSATVLKDAAEYGRQSWCLPNVCRAGPIGQ